MTSIFFRIWAIPGYIILIDHKNNKIMDDFFKESVHIPILIMPKSHSNTLTFQGQRILPLKRKAILLEKYL